MKRFLRFVIICFLFFCIGVRSGVPVLKWLGIDYCDSCAKKTDVVSHKATNANVEEDSIILNDLFEEVGQGHNSDKHDVPEDNDIDSVFNDKDGDFVG